MTTHFDVFARHPLCVCGPVDFGGNVMGSVTVEGCRANAREVYGIDPHPVLNAEDVKTLIDDFKAVVARAGGAGCG